MMVGGILAGLTGEIRKLAQSEVELGRDAAVSNALDFPLKLGLEACGIDELQEGRSGIGIGDHPSRGDFLAVFQNDSDGDSVLHQNSRDRRLRCESELPDFPPTGPRRG